MRLHYDFFSSHCLWMNTILVAQYHGFFHEVQFFNFYCDLLTGRVKNLQIRVAMTAEKFDYEDPESVCTYSEPAFTLAEQRNLPCTRTISGRYVRFELLLTSASYLEMIEVEAHGF